MSKYAYLIEAHNNKKQLELLLKCLDYKENDIFIHIDKKSKNIDELSSEYEMKYSEVFFVPSRKVSWGGYSQIQVELDLLEAAMKKYDYERLHLISGVDLPLVSQKCMHKFFDENKGVEFVHYDYKNYDEIYERRMAQYHLLRENIDRNQKIGNAIEKISLVLQKLIGINRIKDAEYGLYKGANWFSITGECANYVLSKKEWIRKTFKYTKCCDEIFLQTIVANSRFKDRRYYDPIEKRYGNLRLIDWNRGTPYVFREDDYDELIQNSHYMFARKFDQNVDIKIIEKLVKYVTNMYR